MNSHWNADDELARCIAADELARERKGAWPNGATAGLLLVAVACLALGTVLYQFAGPRDVVAEGTAQR